MNILKSRKSFRNFTNLLWELILFFIVFSTYNYKYAIISIFKKWFLFGGRLFQYSCSRSVLEAIFWPQPENRKLQMPSSEL